MSSAVFSYTPNLPQPSAWEKALGLEGSSGLARIGKVQDGLPVTAFHRFADTSGVSREELASAIHVSLRTVQRRSETGGRLDAGPSERLVRLADLYSSAAEIIGDDTLARQWMRTPRDVFGGRTPFELAGSELGAREVEDLLLRVEHGVFY
jgi:putative toxin-antitoxin system antitoxin component (TIGR02293 family)